MKLRLLLFLFVLPAFLPATPMYSPTWGFWIDLPEGYVLSEGNNADRYSFQGPQGAMFDIVVYDGVYADIGQMAGDVKLRLKNTGDIAPFQYGDKAAALMELRFGNFTGWGLCVELGGGSSPSGEADPPLMLALSYAPAGRAGMDLFHMSALDSVAPEEIDRRRPGPVMEFTYPRGGRKEAVVAGTLLRAIIREHDAEAAQALIDREFNILRQYQFARNWQEAWTRFYRAIYRDSWDRVADAVSKIARDWNTTPDRRAFAEKTLVWIQGFKYERDLNGSDFVNLVSAVTEGRGDCDSRAMLWAMILIQADIPAAIMVSRDYSHAMGLADIDGSGARFEYAGIKWLVAETTKGVPMGLIAQDMSDSNHWLGILFN